MEANGSSIREVDSGLLDEKSGKRGEFSTEKPISNEYLLKQRELKHETVMRLLVRYQGLLHQFGRDVY